MLHDLDNTIAQLLQSNLPANLAKAPSISFDAPGEAFPPASLHLPAVNLYLYSATPNMDLRDNGTVVQRLPNGAAQRVRPPAHIDCSYLVSVWPDAASGDAISQEHNLFGEVMRALLASPVVPQNLLQGALQRTQGDPITARVEPSTPDKLNQVWQALGKPGKLSLTYTVSFSVPLAEPEPVVLVTDKLLKFRNLDTGAPS